MSLLSAALRAALLAAVAAPTLADQPVENWFAGAPFSSATAEPWPPGHLASATRRVPDPLSNKDPS